MIMNTSEEEQRIIFYLPNLSGAGEVAVVDRKTGRDWAEQIKELLDVDYPQAKSVVLVCDNLNTHRPASLYERYCPEQARRLLNRLEIHYPPKHGSWLNIAEIELSALTKQCLNRRIADKTTLMQETQFWAQTRNRDQKGADWRFTTQDGRIKLKRLYPIYLGANEGPPVPTAPQSLSNQLVESPTQKISDVQ
jgi:hypothetical protein